MTSTLSRDWMLYILAVTVLGAGAAGLQEAQDRHWLVTIKKPLPIQKLLMDMDLHCLGPFVFKSSDRLDSETENALGTKEYINWKLDLPGDQKVWRGPALFSVSYYTGKLDQLPHVPEECLWQGGLSPAGDDDTIDLAVPGHVTPVPLRRLSFYAHREEGAKVLVSDGTKIYVYYTICVNGEYFANRDWARTKMTTPSESHMYYSKVDAMFEGVAAKDLAKLDEKAKGLLGGVIAELIRSHYPPKGWEKGGPPAAGPADNGGDRR